MLTERNAYRMVDASGTATITFALSGLGEVWIDDISIEPLVVATPAGPAGRSAGVAAPCWERENARAHSGAKTSAIATQRRASTHVQELRNPALVT